MKAIIMLRFLESGIEFFIRLNFLTPNSRCLAFGPVILKNGELG
ncbi:hypothetical protein LEP1GSC171_1537 [Leptospira santarosai str. HAI1380]|nr:hypothetical protein LEP1GSC171_1537 [Leptospira santarosai str. HAI1380]